MGSRRGRTLSEADLALWRQVARSVTPLPGRLPVEPELTPAAPELEKPAPFLLTVAVKAQGKAPSPPPLAPLEERLRIQLRRGQLGVDAVIDLHGMRQDEAHLALRAFLRREQGRGTRLALVVTGKGAAGAAPFGDERGVLRRVVPHWLRLPDLRPLVVGFEEAQARHGGSGALYVRLRRSRENQP